MSESSYKLRIESSYKLRIGNTPDGDGHYIGEVVKDGEVVKVLFRSTREQLEAAARAWVAVDRHHVPDDVEEIEL